MKKRLTLSLILTLLDEGKKYDLYTDVSHQGLRVVLIQKRKVITYTFYQLKEYETRYSTHDLELAIMVFTLMI